MAVFFKRNSLSRSMGVGWGGRVVHGSTSTGETGSRSQASSKQRSALCLKNWRVPSLAAMPSVLQNGEMPRSKCPCPCSVAIRCDSYTTGTCESRPSAITKGSSMFIPTYLGPSKSHPKTTTAQEDLRSQLRKMEAAASEENEKMQARTLGRM